MSCPDPDLVNRLYKLIYSGTGPWSSSSMDGHPFRLLENRVLSRMRGPTQMLTVMALEYMWDKLRLTRRADGSAWWDGV